MQDSIEAGAPLAFAVAVHNIPEGLAVAMPVLHATGSKSRAILLGGLSGMAEPFAALLASFVANEASSPSLFGCLFGLTAVRDGYLLSVTPDLHSWPLLLAVTPGRYT